MCVVNFFRDANRAINAHGTNKSPRSWAHASALFLRVVLYPASNLR